MFVKTLKIGSDKTLGTNSTVEQDLSSLENMISNNRDNINKQRLTDVVSVNFNL